MPPAAVLAGFGLMFFFGDISFFPKVRGRGMPKRVFPAFFSMVCLILTFQADILMEPVFPAGPCMFRSGFRGNTNGFSPILTCKAECGMNIIETELSGVLIIEPKVFGDARGYFFESWNQAAFEAAGITDKWVKLCSNT